MRVSSINIQTGKNPGFGRITTGAIDAFRNRIEGYEIQKDEFLQTEKESYDTSNGYKLLNKKQLTKINELTDKASILKKTIIGPAIRHCRPCNPVNDGLSVLIYGTGHIRNFNFDKKGDFEKNIKIFEEAVEYAQKVEDHFNVEKIGTIKDEILGYGSIFPNRTITNDHFKAKTLYRLNQIYSKTDNVDFGYFGQY